MRRYNSCVCSKARRQRVRSNTHIVKQRQFGWVSYNENEWYHMVIVIEGANIHPKWYMNGSKTGTDN